MKKVRWGVLGVARIATVKVIPAMQLGEYTEIAAIASRDIAKAQRAAAELNIPKAYGSYEELLADPEIDAIYNPLPNHLHVPWSIRAAEAGKHVLCEKPIGLTAAEAVELIAVRDRTGVVMGEAFMIVCHPQWIRAMELSHSGRIGVRRAAIGSFGYFKLDPENVRNIREYGGGGLMDVGCYPIKAARMFFGEEPVRVSGTMVRDPNFQTDLLASGLLEFPSGHCVFTCGTQVVANQSMKFLGTTGSIEFEIPFNAIPGEISRLRVDDGSDLRGGGIQVEEFAPCDQYTLQGDAFSRAVLERTAPPVPLEDALANMRVIEALFQSAETGTVVTPGGF
ncbi:MAG TPA: Gfo/Idh/MocA family oxidoreductase [Candidatus Sulfopaludibacter sp.]|jgi:predicted dehydrogenase|nr:Gfo/Idh/MocA family oxidoreductase [Candidatus Sulfopaludibacter sp.]